MLLTQNRFFNTLVVFILILSQIGMGAPVAAAQNVPTSQDLLMDAQPEISAAKAETLSKPQLQMDAPLPSLAQAENPLSPASPVGETVSSSRPGPGLRIRPFSAWTSLSPLGDPSFSVSVKVDAKGKAVIEAHTGWGNEPTTYAGTFNPRTNQIVVGNVIVHVKPQGNGYYISSFEIQHGTQVAEKYTFTPYGLPSSHEIHEKNPNGPITPNNTDQRWDYTYVKIGGKYLYDSAVLTTVHTAGNSVYTDLNKTYLRYNNEGLVTVRLVTSSVRGPSGIGSFSATYSFYNFKGDTLTQASYSSTNAALIDQLNSRINSWKDCTVIDQYAPSRRIYYQLMDNTYNNHSYRYYVDEVKNAQGVFVPKMTAHLTNGLIDKIWIVQGKADILSKEKNDIYLAVGQTVNGYSVTYGSTNDVYGLIFSKGDVRVTIDYPKIKTVELDGKKYSVLIDDQGIVTLALKDVTVPPQTVRIKTDLADELVVQLNSDGSYTVKNGWNTYFSNSEKRIPLGSGYLNISFQLDKTKADYGTIQSIQLVQSQAMDTAFVEKDQATGVYDIVRLVSTAADHSTVLLDENYKSGYAVTYARTEIGGDLLRHEYVTNQSGFAPAGNIMMRLEGADARLVDVNPSFFTHQPFAALEYSVEGNLGFISHETADGNFYAVFPIQTWDIDFSKLTQLPFAQRTTAEFKKLLKDDKVIKETHIVTPTTTIEHGFLATLEDGQQIYGTVWGGKILFLSSFFSTEAQVSVDGKITVEIPSSPTNNLKKTYDVLIDDQGIVTLKLQKEVAAQYTIDIGAGLNVTEYQDGSYDFTSQGQTFPSDADGLSTLITDYGAPVQIRWNSTNHELVIFDSSHKEFSRLDFDLVNGKYQIREIVNGIGTDHSASFKFNHVNKRMDVSSQYKSPEGVLTHSEASHFYDLNQDLGQVIQLAPLNIYLVKFPFAAFVRAEDYFDAAITVTEGASIKYFDLLVQGQPDLSEEVLKDQSERTLERMRTFLKDDKLVLVGQEIASEGNIFDVAYLKNGQIFFGLNDGDETFGTATDAQGKITLTIPQIGGGTKVYDVLINDQGIVTLKLRG